MRGNKINEVSSSFQLGNVEREDSNPLSDNDAITSSDSQNIENKYYTHHSPKNIPTYEGYVGYEPLL
jgi:hypothetical protein